jgi:hypothetical protein
MVATFLGSKSLACRSGSWEFLPKAAKVTQNTGEVKIPCKQKLRHKVQRATSYLTDRTLHHLKHSSLLSLNRQSLRKQANVFLELRNDNNYIEISSSWEFIVPVETIKPTKPEQLNSDIYATVTKVNVAELRSKSL